MLQYEFKLPDIGEGVAEGEILKWMVKVGDAVKEDQPLVEVMTDKVNVQIPSPRSGVVSSILVNEGEVVRVGQTIVIISEEGEKSEAAAQPGERPPQPMGGTQAATETSQEGIRVLATPATRRLARELAVDISKVRGTGPQGRVTDDDVKASSQSGREAHQSMPSPPASERGLEETVPLRGVRKTIAERMVKSKDVAAHVTHVDEADVTELVILREAFKGSAEKRGVKLTFLPFVIKAIIRALRDFPFLNASLDETATNIIVKRYYNIGIATDTEQGLLVPVIRDADKKDIFELARQTEDLAEKARTGRLALEEVHGSTFTVTNLGGIGGLFATPIINPPEAAILGMHKITKRPVVKDGKLEFRDIMYVSLSFDHRLVDGAYAARFVNQVVEIIQDPKKLLAEVL